MHGPHSLLRPCLHLIRKVEASKTKDARQGIDGCSPPVLDQCQSNPSGLALANLDSFTPSSTSLHHFEDALV
jgi:hypothetical protein